MSIVTYISDIESNEKAGCCLSLKQLLLTAKTKIVTMFHQNLKSGSGQLKNSKHINRTCNNLSGKPRRIVFMYLRGFSLREIDEKCAASPNIVLQIISNTFEKN